MELRTFITQALLDVIAGVSDAQSKSQPGIIVPGNFAASYKALEAGITEYQIIDFEVTIQADERSGMKSGLDSSAEAFPVAASNPNPINQLNRIRISY
jgi:hypothetical protein